MKKLSTLLDPKNFESIRELNCIINISRSIIGTLDYQKVLQIVSDGMSELLDIETAAIYTLENEEELRLGATTPPLDSNMPDNLRIAYLSDHPHIHKAVTKREPIVIRDTKRCKLSDAEKMIVEMRNLRSLLYFPFVQEKNVLGVLILGTCNRSRMFEKHEIELARTVAHQLTVAIQNSRFHSDLFHYKNNLEKLVSERTYELEAANEELKSMNEELQNKNEIVLSQKREIEESMKDLETTKIKLFQSEKMASLGILTAGVAHEINNPLNYIMWANQGLEEYFSKSAEAQRNDVAPLLEGIKTGVERVSAIVKMLNRFSKDSESNNEQCQIHSIIDNCLLMMQNQFKADILIEKSYFNEEIVINGNEGKLHQVIIHLLNNSMHAIQGAGHIKISTNKQEDGVHISIIDSGCGIAPEHLPRVFDPFFTTKDPLKGVGLGLSMSYHIVREHHGRIEIESEIDKGTTARIVLPFNKENSN